MIFGLWTYKDGEVQRLSKMSAKRSCRHTNFSVVQVELGEQALHVTAKKL